MQWVALAVDTVALYNSTIALLHTKIGFYKVIELIFSEKYLQIIAR